MCGPLGHPFVSNPSLIAHIGVSLACRCICLQRKLFLHSERRTSLWDYAFPKPSPWHDSGHTKCSMSRYFSEWTTVWALGEFSTSPGDETCFCTGWWVGFLSRREFHSVYNPRSELHPLIFAEQFKRCRYHLTREFHRAWYTVIVNTYSNLRAAYKQLYQTSTWRNLTDTLNASRRIQPSIHHC